MTPTPAPETPLSANAPLEVPGAGAREGVSPGAATKSRFLLGISGWLALAALMAAGLLWQKVTGMQEQLARQSADAGAQSIEARTLARQALDQARETAARQAVAEAKLSEVSLQRAQVEDLIQSLSRSRDENLVVDIESAVRLALQQAQLTGSAAPLLAALKSADQRVARAGQARLAPLQRALGRDIDRVTSASVTDTPGLLIRLDELVPLIDDLPLVNAAASAPTRNAVTAPGRGDVADWWQRALSVLGRETRNLVRVSRIEQPEAMLLSPEQSFFFRENLKLKLLNARLGLLARQLASSRADLAEVAAAVNRYCDPGSRKTQTVATVLQQIQSQMRSVELPRVDDTLAALTTAAAGR